MMRIFTTTEAAGALGLTRSGVLRAIQRARRDELLVGVKRGRDWILGDNDLALLRGRKTKPGPARRKGGKRNGEEEERA